MDIRRTFAACVVLAGFIASPALAQQSTARGDVAVGYSVVTTLSNSNTGAESATYPLGWLFSVSTKMGPVASLVGEVGGSYKTQSVLGTDVNSNIHSFAGGIRFAGSGTGASPFGQFLIGTARSAQGISGIGSFSTTGLVMQPGAGVDIPLSESVALRAQGDFALFRADGVTDHAFRLAFSAAFRF